MQQLLDKQLNRQGYHKSEITPGFWTHDWRLIWFSLCFDDFGVKYVGNHHAEHPMTVFREHNKKSHDWRGQRYLRLDIDWDYDHRKLHLLMLPYIIDALPRFLHANPRKLQHQPYPHIKPTYDANSQYVEAADMSPPLSKAD